MGSTAQIFSFPIKPGLNCFSSANGTEKNIQNGDKAEHWPYLEHQYGNHALKATEASECFHSQQQSAGEVYHANNEIQARTIHLIFEGLRKESGIEDRHWCQRDLLWTSSF